MMRKKKDQEQGPKILDIDASMQGTINFHDPVNLRINGEFEGQLNTKGTLTISEKANVKANINGDDIIIAGKVTGDIVATKRLKIENPGQLFGNVRTPLMVITEGALLHGDCNMKNKSSKAGDNGGNSFYSLNEVASYLEVDSKKIEEWANKGSIPAVKEANNWKFERTKIEDWIAKQG